VPGSRNALKDVHHHRPASRPGTRTRSAITSDEKGAPMKALRDCAGRPARLDYEPGERCQLNVVLPPLLKRDLVEHAERNERRLRDEVRLALSSWCEHAERALETSA